MYPLLSNPTLHVSFKQTLSWVFIDVTLSRDCFMATETAVEIQRTYLEMSTRYYCIEWLLFVYWLHVCELHCYCSNNSELKSATDPAAKY